MGPLRFEILEATDGRVSAVSHYLDSAPELRLSAEQGRRVADAHSIGDLFVFSENPTPEVTCSQPSPKARHCQPQAADHANRVQGIVNIPRKRDSSGANHFDRHGRV